jgi:dienelactone hydrolase
MQKHSNKVKCVGMVVCVAIIVALAGCATTAATRTTQPPPGDAQTADGGYRTFRPDGLGPHPALVILSGCSGLTPSVAPHAYERVAEQLRAQGYLVIFADYLGRRGLTSCTGAPITHADAAQDLVAAANWLKAQPIVDPTRITAMGWSYGGGAVLVALATYAGERLAFSRAVTYYPDCRSVRLWTNPMPVLMLLAGDDDVAPGTRCQEAARQSATPAAVKVVVYPGARHGFDASELPAKLTYPLGTLGYHPQAAAAAWDEVQRFLPPAK